MQPRLIGLSTRRTVQGTFKKWLLILERAIHPKPYSLVTPIISGDTSPSFVARLKPAPIDHFLDIPINFAEYSAPSYKRRDKLRGLELNGAGVSSGAIAHVTFSYATVGCFNASK